MPSKSTLYIFHRLDGCTMTEASSRAGFASYPDGETTERFRRVSKYREIVRAGGRHQADSDASLLERREAELRRELQDVRRLLSARATYLEWVQWRKAL